jgi:hypothetical protein
LASQRDWHQISTFLVALSKRPSPSFVVFSVGISQIHANTTPHCYQNFTMSTSGRTSVKWESGVHEDLLIVLFKVISLTAGDYVQILEEMNKLGYPLTDRGLRYEYDIPSIVSLQIAALFLLSGVEISDTRSPFVLALYLARSFSLIWRRPFFSSTLHFFYHIKFPASTR